jgi:Ca2+-binding EF-hand superfamily protein
MDSVASLSESEKLEQLRSTFRACDRNGDGFIDIDELFLLWDELNLPANTTQSGEIEKLFQAIDINHDGHITCEEFVGSLDRLLELVNDAQPADELLDDEAQPQNDVDAASDELLRERLWSVFETCDADQTGIVDLLHLRDLLVTLGFAEEEQTILNIFRARDTDGDGCLTFEEFVSSVKDVIDNSSKQQQASEYAGSDVSVLPEADLSMANTTASSLPSAPHDTPGPPSRAQLDPYLSPATPATSNVQHVTATPHVPLESSSQC